MDISKLSTKEISELINAGVVVAPPVAAPETVTFDRARYSFYVADADSPEDVRGLRCIVTSGTLFRDLRVADAGLPDGLFGYLQNALEALALIAFQGDG